DQILKLPGEFNCEAIRKLLLRFFREAFFVAVLEILENCGGALARFATDDIHAFGAVKVRGFLERWQLLPHQHAPKSFEARPDCRAWWAAGGRTERNLFLVRLPTTDFRPPTQWITSMR